MRVSLAHVRRAQENHAENLAAIDAILRRERAYVFEIPHGEDVVALMSGGLDSTVMADLVMDEWKCRVHPVFVRRGARAQRWEEEAFDFFCGHFGLKKPMKIDAEVPPKALKPHFSAAVQRVIGHPMRNATLQNLGVMAAVAINARDGLSIRTVFSGSVADDGTGPELGLLGLRVQMLSTCVHLADWTWQVTSPMTDPCARKAPLFKRDLLARARARGIPVGRTRSCFEASKRPCGTCTGCEKRARAQR
jgi:7-cyano-7-deazaguanine synthase in queuosine biosynthesis